MMMTSSVSYKSLIYGTGTASDDATVTDDALRLYFIIILIIVGSAHSGRRRRRDGSHAYEECFDSGSMGKLVWCSFGGVGP